MRTITREIVATAIFSSDNKLLLGKTALSAGGVYNGHWVIPGGGIEPGETKMQALQREILEETQLDISTYEVRPIERAKIRTGESEKTLKETGERVFVKMNFNDYEVRIPQPANRIAAKPTEELVKLTWADSDEWPRMELSPPTVELLIELGYMHE